ncbi:MAG UNVERIFIED_CONTAM: hypothetical protein LVR18_40040 [Planctomycetaceae bacterium]
MLLLSSWILTIGYGRGCRCGEWDAESLRDGLLLVSGALSERLYGPADALEVRGDGLVTVRSEAEQLASQ